MSDIQKGAQALLEALYGPQEKTAGFGDLNIGQIVAEQALRSGVTVGLGTGTMLALNAISKKDAESSKDKKFEAMLAEHPDLLEKHDIEKVKKKFDSIHKWSPALASDAHNVGEIVRSQMQFGGEGLTVGAIRDLNSLQREYEQTHHQQLAMDPIDRLTLSGKLQKA